MHFDLAYHFCLLAVLFRPSLKGRKESSSLSLEVEYEESVPDVGDAGTVYLRIC